VFDSFAAVCVLAGIAALAGGAPELRAKKEKDAERDARIAVVRNLAHEIGVTKVVLPRGKRGLFVAEDGQVDQERLEKELRANGPAVAPGIPVVITAIKFKGNSVQFELNGGGRKGKKWYQRIEVGMGTSTAPIAPENPTVAQGSFINLRLPKESELWTADEIKQALANVLDFERRSPTVLYQPEVPPEIKKAIEEKRVIVGMDRDAVLSAKGPPDRRIRERGEDAYREEWIYGLPPDVVFVTFEGDQVVSVRRHGEMAEPDAKAAEPEDPEDAPAPAEQGSAGSDSAGSITPQPYQPLNHAPFN
jgi:hypothetical protein